MHSEQSGDTDSKVDPTSQTVSKKKRRPKKPKSASTTSNKENLATVGEETPVNAESSEITKKKKKRKNKKKKAPTTEGEKTENLISITFKASKTESCVSDELKENLLNGLKPDCIKSNCSNRLKNSKNKSTISNAPINVSVNVGKTEQISTKNDRAQLEQARSPQKKNLQRKQCKEGNRSQSNSESSPKNQEKAGSETVSSLSATQRNNKRKKRKEQIANSSKTTSVENPISKDTESQASSMDVGQKEKSRQEILADREAKKLAKQAAKKGNTSTSKIGVPLNTKPDMKVNPEKTDFGKNASNNKKMNEDKSKIAPQKPTPLSTEQKINKSREDILAEREAKKLAKQAAKIKNKAAACEGDTSVPANKGAVQNKTSVENLANKIENLQITVPDGQKKKPTTKAERRAIQEAQREAKAKILSQKQQSQKPAATVGNADTQKRAVLANSISSDNRKIEKVSTINTSPSKPRAFKVKFFNQLETKVEEQNLFVNSSLIHPVMVRLGEQYAKRIVVGSNARCIAFLDALKTVIQDYETPPKKEFSRGLEASIKNSVDHLQKCRPLAVSVSNAYKYIKVVLTKLPPNQPESELKKYLVELIDIYVKDQIEKAAQAISYNVQESIKEGDVILTYGCSSLITYILEEAHRKQIDFRVIVVDSHPFCEGQELLRRLVSKGISCTCVLINAVGFIMPEVTKVLLGAHALLANGYVVSRIGTAQVALVARSFNVSVFVCCEKHKFSERTQTDAIVYNELGNPNDLISKTRDCKLKDWKSFPSLYPLNLNYDVTPPELVNVVVTEVTLMPSTSAPVILRIRPNEMIS